MGAPLDLACLGRAAVDLYGEQVGCPLEEVATFARYLGGSPANTAVGAARLLAHHAALAVEERLGKLELAERVGEVTRDGKRAALGEHVDALGRGEEGDRVLQALGRHVLLEVREVGDRVGDEVVEHGLGP